MNLNLSYLKNIAGLLMIVLPFAAYAEFPVKIFPGSGGFLHDKEIDDGLIVWALLKNKEGHELRKVKVAMKSEHHPLRDNSGQKSMRILVHPEKNKTLLLLTDFIGAKSGPVNITYYDKVLVKKWFQQKISPTSVNFEYGGNTYTLRAEYGGDVNARRSSFNSFKIILAHKNKEQILFQNSQAVDPFAALVWVGDIDRDKQPDLLIKTSTHYSYIKTRLFLFSQSDKDNFVKQVGVYYSGE